MFARMARRREKRLLRCRNLEDAVCSLDRDFATFLTRRLELEPWRQDKVATMQRSALKLKKPLRHKQRNRRRASFLPFLTSVLTRRLEREHEDRRARLLVSNRVGVGRKFLVG